MLVIYKNKQLERVLIGINVLTAGLVTVSFVLLFGYEKPLLPVRILYVLQVALLWVFIAEKIIRFFNASLKSEFWRANWFEIPLLVALVIVVIGTGRWFAKLQPDTVRHFA
ncbi:MAG: hypothetical protein ACYS8Y_07380, partial [Planctomycetota bacterium]